MTDTCSVGVVGKLGAIAAFLLALATATTSASALPLPQYAVASDWACSDAALTSGDSESARHMAIDAALAEVRLASTILEVDTLHPDPSFPEYLEQVERALTAYELPSRGPEHIRSLATSLALARDMLQSQVRTVPRWIALAQATHASTERYLKIPDRFVEEQQFRIARETAPTLSDLDDTLEFDDYMRV